MISDSRTAHEWGGQIIREELFSVERLEAHARSLAIAQTTQKIRSRSPSLVARLADNSAALRLAYEEICAAVDNGHAITPAAEWLIDSYHLVERQFREISLDLPPGYYRQLPTLAREPFAGHPRVFGIAWALVAHTDSRFDAEAFRRFVLAYQEASQLTIGELWAVSITLRIVLVENLRRVADLIVTSRNDRKAANDFANRILGSLDHAADPIGAVLASWADDNISNAFAVQFLQRLRDQDARVMPAMTWLEEKLAATGRTPGQVVSDEHLRQAGATVTVSNIITSLRTITSIDWSELFESISPVDEVLRADPNFPAMDFVSRNLYRGAIEELARGSKIEETEIARRAIAAPAPQAPTRGDGDPVIKVGAGYHLIGPGRRQFERSLGFRPRLALLMRRFCRFAGVGGYVAGFALCTLGVIYLLALPLLAATTSNLVCISLLVLAAIPASDAAVALVNCIIVHVMQPSLLPALELKSGVPAAYRTLVVVPTLLTSLEAVAKYIETLEVHHLACPDGEVYFALLSDWVDADTQSTPADEALLQAAIVGVAGLNKRYPAGSAGQRFTLLHRERAFHASEGNWLGWERKRGKLHQLNKLLRSGDGAGFAVLDGVAPFAPEGVRLVLTLDADTRLPLDSVRKLVGKMAHPLNLPRFDAKFGRIAEGRGVVQPRVTPTLPAGGSGSIFQSVFSTPSGIDPYVSAVSDVYQDLFDEGSFAGKGIYDVDAFEMALAGRIPESTLLSHDLFEGIFARAGFASDVEVMEEFPDRYEVACMRQHRWTRGDWQLLPWILGFAHGAASQDPDRRRIPASGRWKMVDNLRRSLSAPSFVAALIAGWLTLDRAALAWTLCLVALVVAPLLIPVICSISLRKTAVPLSKQIRALGNDARYSALQALFVLIFLADQAVLMADAILRTLYRLFVSRANMLEWVSHAQASESSQTSLLVYARRMLGAVIIGAVTFAIGWVRGAPIAFMSAPFAIAWIASPLAAAWTSMPHGQAWRALYWAQEKFPAAANWLNMRPAGAPVAVFDERDKRALRRTARRTWRFFETFVTPAENMLPPDNFQEIPSAVIAHRTSPTNIGLYLLSTICARDFGWIGLTDAIERIEATLATMNRMERVRGHFFNWYDTQSLAPLEPKYVSSVDSGNLAGHLIALSQACSEWRLSVGQARADLTGVVDALEIARSYLDAPPRPSQSAPDLLMQIETLIARARANALNAGAILALADAVAAMNRAPAPAKAVRAALKEGPNWAEVEFWLRSAASAVEHPLGDAKLGGDIDGRLERIARQAYDFALATDFGFLLDPKRKLLSIGYVVHEDRLDPSCYDLLASEARLASFFAIAKGDVQSSHWFRLGRAVVLIDRRAALLSWSGSMFEYLMPSLVMRAPAGSLVEQTNRLIVRAQIDYGKTCGVPWGISESAYNVRDLDFTYQYSNFGVPGLGLKRGLDANIVVAPYATALAAMVDPKSAVQNLRRLASAGALGDFGYYEALDYTPVRLPARENVAIVKAYMAHHQGMTIVSIANAVLGALMPARFHSEPIIQASELLLQERPPRDVLATRTETGARSNARVQTFELAAGRKLTAVNDPSPATQLLSNGRYSVMLTSAGSGYSRWGDIAITRWREDPTCDNFGSYIYLRDIESGSVWSAGCQPCGGEPDELEAVFNEDRAAFSRRDGALTTTMEIVVSSEDDAEVRQIAISNAGKEPRDIEITSYMELALAPQAADRAHPAFSKMFVQTEFLPGPEAIIATRRRREQTEPEIWAAHLAVAESDSNGDLEYETDRTNFLGRNRTARAPQALFGRTHLNGASGTVLDPVFALRRTLRVQPGGIARIAFWTIAASSRAALLDCIDKHRDSTAFARAATMAWSQAQVQLHHFGVDPAAAATIQRLGGHLIFANAAMRSSSATILQGAGAQPELWSQGISGDLPIVVIRITENEHLTLVRELLVAHEFFRTKHFGVDLVVLNERAPSYVQDLQSDLESVVRVSQSRRAVNDTTTSGRIFVLRSDLIPAKARALLLSIARVVLTGQRGSLSDQLDNAFRPLAKAPQFPVRPFERRAIVAPPAPKLEFFNGYGGFGDDGREYVIQLRPKITTPSPWINVIANPGFGFQAAAEGSGFTWCGNSRENQLTPWSNDPVSDPAGEALYLRDESTGEFWSATASPIRVDGATYIAKHGRGYSRFEHESHGIGVNLVQFAPVAEPVKISRLQLRNLSDRARRISLTAYVEWALGPAGTTPAPFIATARDLSTGAIFAQNAWGPAFARHVAFLDLKGAQAEWTCDRREFIGRHGELANPAALRAAKLASAAGSGLDPCGALRAFVDIPAGGTVELVCLLGQGADIDQAKGLVAQFRAANLDEIFEQVRQQWQDILDKVVVKTPDRALDIMLNGWLLYQTVACRIWARSAFYQASGAYGFRDQLQDGMAIAATSPHLTREHIVRASARQFPQGDVQHWWLPENGKGVRTRISDDRAWLAYAVSHYIDVTSDAAILDETTPFIEGQALREGERDSFFEPAKSEDSVSLFEHCARALDHSLATGANGLPLMGSGDWNDGMNRVGDEGRGESVWLAWLLHAALSAFAPIAERRGARGRAANWRRCAHDLKKALEEKAWDGEWYRRGYYDDGSPLGSSTSDECQIDSIAQSWSLISGCGDATRAALAMRSVENKLILHDEQLALLFTPPFDKGTHDPGYIKGYPPGLRENGGQYTHAACWAVFAFARLGEGESAAALLSIINPIKRALNYAQVKRYVVEPYVVAADIYASPDHLGRGGWTWYTGSAGWMQRAGIESVLGLQMRADSLSLDPCIPRDWDGFSIALRHGGSQYSVEIRNPNHVCKGITSAKHDSEQISVRPFRIELVDDGRRHHIELILGQA